MSLKLYRIDTTLNHPYNGARIEKYNKDIGNLFCSDEGDEEKILKFGLTFVAQKGYTLKNISNTDCMISAIGLLFSGRFINILGKKLEEDIQFYPCILKCENIDFKWYAIRIKRRIPIIDETTSIYRELSDGIKFLDVPRFKKDISTPFFIAKDTVWKSCYVVSELFKELCEKNNMLIEFDTPEIF